MPAEARDRRPASRPAKGLLRISVAVFVGAAAAGAAGNLIHGPYGLAAAGVIAVLAAVVAGFAVRPKAMPVRTTTSAAPDELARERDKAARAAEQLEKAKRHAELASLQVPAGKDARAETPQRRVGALGERWVA